MIAANFRKYPDAMALQRCLPFGRCCWHTSRPTTRALRAVRAARAALVKVVPQIVRWVPVVVPQWVRDAKRRAVELAKGVKDALLSLVWDLEEVPAEESAPISGNKCQRILADGKPCGLKGPCPDCGLPLHDFPEGS
jgi:hypothetical protein